jgi:hypothetical protein
MAGLMERDLGKPVCGCDLLATPHFNCLYDRERAERHGADRE